MKIAKIENWFVANRNPTLPPEQSIMSLCGNVYGHDKFTDGEFITTSEICGSNGKLIQTVNSYYILGEVNSDYLNWVRKNNLNWDEIEPIKILKKSEN